MSLCESNERKQLGRIIFVSSKSTINIIEDMIIYGVTKTAYLSLSRGLAKYLKGTNGTSNVILPGPTDSEGATNSFKQAAAEKQISLEEAKLEFIKEKRSSLIIQRFTEAEEVANLAVYVASQLSSATTGAAHRVDGGVVDTAF